VSAIGAEFETPKASSGEGNGEGVSPSPPQPTRGSGESRKPKTDFDAFWAWKNVSGDDTFNIVCHFYSAYLEWIYKASFDIFFSFAGGLFAGGIVPSGPLSGYASVSNWVGLYCYRGETFDIVSSELRLTPIEQLVGHSQNTSLSNPLQSSA